MQTIVCPVAISIHAPHTRSDSIFNFHIFVGFKFQSTPLIRGATTYQEFHACSDYFNPRPSYEERLSIPLKRALHFLFQSTPLIRGATLTPSSVSTWMGYFNPRPSYEERLWRTSGNRLLTKISIHAPHTRSDARYFILNLPSLYFNPRPSYEERLLGCFSS